MNKEVELLQKENIDNYIEFIEKIFEYKTEYSAIEKLMTKDKVLVIKNKDKIIASLVLEECFEAIKNQKYYRLGYFGVLKEYRRMGYANRLFEEVEKLIKENNIKYIELTSGNHRKAAHYFYQSKDFKIKDTTVFVKLY